MEGYDIRTLKVDDYTHVEIGWLNAAGDFQRETIPLSSLENC